MTFQSHSILVDATMACYCGNRYIFFESFYIGCQGLNWFWITTYYIANIIETCHPSVIAQSFTQIQGHYNCKFECLLGVARDICLYLQIHRHVWNKSLQVGQKLVLIWCIDTLVVIVYLVEVNDINCMITSYLWRYIPRFYFWE